MLLHAMVDRLGVSGQGQTQLGVSKMLDRHYRRKDVETITGLSRSTLYVLMSRGEFPRPVKLTGKKAVAWPESAISEWLATRIKA
jgi:prophage regulatory protein